MTYKATNPPGVVTLQSLSALPPYSRKPGPYGPTMSVCAKVMSRGVHNIAFSLSPDGFCVSDLVNEPKSGLTCRGRGPQVDAKGRLPVRGHKASLGTNTKSGGDPYPFVLLVLDESPLGHLRYLLNRCAAPPSQTPPPDNVFDPDRHAKDLGSQKGGTFIPAPPHRISKKTIKVVVFQRRRSSHLCYTLYVFSQCQTRVKLNRVFFPR
jgi:hypothetical protein